MKSVTLTDYETMLPDGSFAEREVELDEIAPVIPAKEGYKAEWIYAVDSDGNYTTLVMPESITTPVSGSYLVEDGYAAYEKASVTDNMATYTLVKGTNSTKYGIITSNYADANAYPIILFKDGVLISAHQTLASAITAANDLLGNEAHANDQAEILFRK